tara:strand:- start:4141 stop:4944 length:804 start_codon:yes stop_codon:yes gene_type:complete
MREDYFQGSRLSATWRRATRQIDRKKTFTDNFIPIKILNKKPGKKGVVSFSLFGEGKGERFWKGLVEPIIDNSREINEILPGWIIRVYISSSLPDKVFNVLLSSDCELIVMKPAPNQEPFTGLLWRFLVADEDVPFLVCDADMRLSDDSIKLNNLKDVPEWLSSGKPFFRRKGFPSNIMWPICAGGWGGRPKNGKPAIPNIRNLLERYRHDWFGCDEAFLTQEMWPVFKKEGYYTSYSLAEKIFWVILLVLIVLVIARRLQLNLKKL